jgi:hypothetical protein
MILRHGVGSLVLWLLAGTAAGCGATHSIQPGLWLLNATGRQYDFETGEPGDEKTIRGRRVRVVLGWRERDGQSVETVEIHYHGETEPSPLEEERLKNNRPMTGTIEKKPSGTVQLDAHGGDAGRELQLVGEVRSERAVWGKVFAIPRAARGNPQEGIEGEFTMEKIPED